MHRRGESSRTSEQLFIGGPSLHRARRSLVLLVAFALLCGTVLVSVFSDIGARPAAAAANAVVPDSAISGFTPSQFAGNDDGTYPCGGSGHEASSCTGSETGPTAVPLGFNIDFFGTEYSGAYVNNNGNVTFDNPLSTYTPFGLEGTSSVIIAPFFSDVDTTVGNTAELGTGTLDGHKVFVVNWPGVGCFSGNDTVTDDFQMILIDRSDRATGPLGDDFDIEFNYNSIQWDAGEASGGNSSCTGAPDASSAAVGYSNGTTTPGDSFELPGSQTSGALLDSNTTTGLVNNDLNSTVLGRYLFSVQSGQPSSAAPTSLSTSQSGGGQTGTDITVPSGTAVTDTATLTGANAGSATGTVTYTVFSDPECTTSVDGGTPVTITTPGTLPPSSPVTLSAGTYYWQAAYSGDSTNASSTSTCGSTGEVTTVGTSTASTTLHTSLSGGGKSGASITVPPSTAVTDTATLTGTNAGSATGTVTYDAYSDSGCTTAVASGTAKTITTPGTLPPSSAVTLTRRDLLLAGVVLR